MIMDRLNASQSSYLHKHIDGSIRWVSKPQTTEPKNSQVMHILDKTNNAKSILIK